MKILISGICGFVGSVLAAELGSDHEVFGFDNFIRPGSETNRKRLGSVGIKVFHADLRSATDLGALPAADWVIDAAALPSVLAGVDGKSSSLQVVEHNLFGTVNLLEYCRRHSAGFTLLSTSRVYSIESLCRIPLQLREEAFCVDKGGAMPEGASAAGVGERFSCEAPISLYGSTKLASEKLALEYGQMFGFPVWINRCGVLAGAGQFGQAEQGIFSFWIHSWAAKKSLRYIGFEGSGAQVRDALHPRDLVPLLKQQMSYNGQDVPRVINVAGGASHAMSLAQLSAWCSRRFGPGHVDADCAPRRFDVPWVVLDCAQAEKHWGWRPKISLEEILSEIAEHARTRPDWLELSRA